MLSWNGRLEDVQKFKAPRGTQFTCFTSANVQILTPEEQAARATGSQWHSQRRSSPPSVRPPTPCPGLSHPAAPRQSSDPAWTPLQRQVPPMFCRYPQCRYPQCSPLQRQVLYRYPQCFAYPVPAKHWGYLPLNSAGTPNVSTRELGIH
jgi:hypothetical protein